jgi:hypothetical protein
VPQLIDKNRTSAALGPRLCFAKTYFLCEHFLHGIYGIIASVNYDGVRFVRLTGKGDR